MAKIFTIKSQKPKMEIRNIWKILKILKILIQTGGNRSGLS